MLSVIISAYNVKDYIEECVQSVLLLEIPLEVIIVHDEEKDNSFIGTEKFLQDKRITILNRQNAGLGVARNQGLEVARGDYVLFIDGDDKVFPNNLAKLYDKGTPTNSDIIVGSYDDEGKIIKCYSLSDKPFVMKGDEYLVRYGVKTHSMVWRCLYRKQFLLDSNLRFEPIKYCEDMIFMTLSLYRAKRVYYEDIVFYYYRYVDNSLSHVFNKKKILDTVYYFRIVNRECDSIKENEVSSCIRHGINSNLFRLLYAVQKEKTVDSEILEEIKSCIREMKSDRIQVLFRLFIFKYNFSIFNFINNLYCKLKS